MSDTLKRLAEKTGAQVEGFRDGDLWTIRVRKFYAYVFTSPTGNPLPTYLPDWQREARYDCVLETQIHNHALETDMDAVATDILRSMNRDYERWVQDKGYVQP